MHALNIHETDDVCLASCQGFEDKHSRDELKRVASLKTNGATPLVIAAKNGHLQVVEWLLAVGVDIEQVSHLCLEVRREVQRPLSEPFSPTPSFAASSARNIVIMDAASDYHPHHDDQEDARASRSGV